MSADKPEAGRTLGCGARLWRGGICGDGDPIVRLCSPCFQAQHAPLSPAPRPVEPLHGVDADLRGLQEASDAAYERDHPPRTVERCSCEEATRYKAALEAVLARCSGFESVPADQIVDIARRALALGGETET